MQKDSQTMPEIRFPELNVNTYKPNNPVEVTVVDNYIATLENSPNIIRHITFDVSDTELEGNVWPGQSVGIIPEGLTEPDGKPAKVRLYSVSSPGYGEDGKPHLISITVKRVIEEDLETRNLFLGLCSNYLSSLNPGDKVKMTGPSGKRFVLPENARDFNYLFFATGTGIAPYRSMLLDLYHRGFKKKAALIFGAPYRTDLLYDGLFSQLQTQHKHFHYLTSISREGTRPDGTKNYVQYQIEDASKVLQPMLHQSNTLIYICGLKGMESGVFKALAKNGYSEYLEISDRIEHLDPDQWTAEDLKKHVKPSSRLFVEVY
ncbi:hypothetical protein QLX67_02460 [Balneolaceae bacterium ANBcel3]|nr:hypothetical protein [Balneolaceae bacterium ANBcel3]